MTITNRRWRGKSGQKGEYLDTCTEISTLGKVSQGFHNWRLQALLQPRKRLSGLRATTHVVMIHA